MGAASFVDAVSSGGHLLVVQGDLAALAVDAVLIPCDSLGNVNEGFASLLGTVQESSYLPGHVRVPALSEMGGRRGGPVRFTDVGPRQVWLLDTTIQTRKSAEGLVVAVAGAIALIGESLGVGRTVAMPLPGVAEGGFGGSYFSVISTLIPVLEECAANLDLDVVLVVRDRSDFAAVQHFRREVAPRPQAPGGAEGPALSEAAEMVTRLANLAREGRLVAFIGAGASLGAGAPSWWGLLEDLALKAGITQDQIPVLQELDPRDAATVIARRAAAGRPGSHSQPGDTAEQFSDIRQAIVDRVAGDAYTVTQGLIAGLALPEAITTNYDRQYEIANSHTSHAEPGEAFGVLPHVRPRPGSPWVMKLHGDAAQPSSIIISRDDYLRFDRESGPAAGVLQSRMLTGHLLFIGYSMSDEDIVRLARDVQRYREEFNSGDAQEPVGTVLELAPNPLRHQLWEGILDFVTFAPEQTTAGAGSDPAVPMQRAARRLRVFLDLVARYACDDVPYLLDPKYRDLVTHGDTSSEVAEELLDVMGRLARAVRGIEKSDNRSSAAVQVAAERARRMLEEMGVTGFRPT